MMSVVGLLIAGELYLHFKDKSVQAQMLLQLANAIKPFYDGIVLGDNDDIQSIKEGDCDIFLSYCWKNSFIASQMNQVSNVVGHKFSDPRLIKRELEKRLGHPVWIDTERMAGSGTQQSIFEQIAASLAKAKVIVACVSQEYADSQNCRMEFQFAARSLKKPIVALLVGDKEAEWRQTSIGMIVADLDTIVDFQQIKSSWVVSQQSITFDEKIKKICQFVKQLMINPAVIKKKTTMAKKGKMIKKKTAKKPLISQDIPAPPPPPPPMSSLAKPASAPPPPSYRIGYFFEKLNTLYLFFFRLTWTNHFTVNQQGQQYHHEP